MVYFPAGYFAVKDFPCMRCFRNVPFGIRMSALFPPVRRMRQRHSVITYQDDIEDFGIIFNYLNIMVDDEPIISGVEGVCADAGN